MKFRVLKILTLNLKHECFAVMLKIFKIWLCTAFINHIIKQYTLIVTDKEFFVIA